jgi:hypothetical protein
MIDDNDEYSEKHSFPRDAILSGMMIDDNDEHL